MPSSSTTTDQELQTRLAAVRGVVFDVDGCLVLSDKPGGAEGYALAGAVDAVSRIMASGRRVVAFTNASSQTPADIASGLAKLGFGFSPQQVLTPSVVAAELIQDRFPGAPVLAFGGSGLIDVLTANGVVLADPDRPEAAAAVVIGWDLNFGRDQLQAAAEAVWNGAPILVTSDARRFASATKPMVGLGGFIATGLSYVTDTGYEIVGKPSAAAMEMAARRLGCAPHEVLVAGDDLTLEVAMARAASAVGVLVTTGMHGATDADLAPDSRRPDLVIDQLAELADRLQRAHPSGA